MCARVHVHVQGDKIKEITEGRFSIRDFTGTATGAWRAWCDAKLSVEIVNHLTK